MMSCESNEEKLRSHIGRGVRVGVQHPQYDDTDALNYHHVTSYTAEVLSPHIKVLEQGWNEYDDTKKRVCDK